MSFRSAYNPLHLAMYGGERFYMRQQNRVAQLKDLLKEFGEELVSKGATELYQDVYGWECQAKVRLDDYADVQKGLFCVRICEVHCNPKFRSQGIASRLMGNVIDVSNELDVPLFLEAKPFTLENGRMLFHKNTPDMMDEEKLVEWYQKFGFSLKMVGDFDHITMLRKPNQKEKNE